MNENFITQLKVGDKVVVCKYLRAHEYKLETIVNGTRTQFVLESGKRFKKMGDGSIIGALFYERVLPATEDNISKIK